MTPTPEKPDKPEKPPKAGNFVKGDKRVHPGGKATSLENYNYGPEDAAPEELKVWRHVNLNPAMFDTIFPKLSEQHRTIRKIKKSDPKFFYEQLKKMEDAHAIATGKAPAVVAAPVAPQEDMGTDRAAELVTRLLDEFDEEEAGRGKGS